VPVTIFNELPTAVREAVTNRTGRVNRFESAPVGNHAEIAGTLHTEHGRVFVKGTRLLPDQPYGGGEAWSLRNEAAVIPHARPYAPDLLWQVETAGWLLVAFEHIEGRHPRYHPGSADLEPVATVIAGLSELPCPDAVRLRVEDRYRSQDPAAQALAGTALLHCDLNPSNILITPDGHVRVVDWAFASRGAAWLECAFLLPWLVRDGHASEDAEAWLDRFPAWKQADPTIIDSFATWLATAWTRRDVPGAAPWITEYTGIARTWAAHRRNRLATRTQEPA
jgi:Phosphotransferase enzyme family